MLGADQVGTRLGISAFLADCVSLPLGLEQRLCASEEIDSQPVNP